ncbi:MAG: DUF192 domain-containing protein [Armatimonadota bacterium]|nr:DUF192 domain-containing protein [Armatimonadota bacterium]MDR7448530.1 DUF192 domain-containing protein [Armatimonadota bacterium]MDR7460237.1 DUF192 domain-containing protein [Armatimonadota bacterium]MDR7478957.1 DUF192 domain-containing protein [Armatimonadota bacterium]MDR7488355.1 DUF192 domain-containing protein [Armatimonadota bacterium]
MRALIPLVLLLLLVGVPDRATPEPAADGRLFGRGRVVLEQGDRRLVLRVEVAETPEARARGLMFRRTLADDRGMLFIFEEDARWAFWMKNTLIPLSIAFIDRTWRVVDILDMAPASDPEHGPFPVYQPRAPARYALEVRQGLFRRKGIAVGARVHFTRYD